MLTQTTLAPAEGLRFSVEKDGVEVAHAYLYLLRNDLHEKPFGLLEDVHVREDARGSGIGTKLIKAVIAYARAHCYKLIATSRYTRSEVHKLYKKLGFSDHGVEFRITFD